MPRRRLYLHNRQLVGSSMHTREHFALLVQLALDARVQPVLRASASSKTSAAAPG